MRRDHLRYLDYNTLKHYCCDHYIYHPGEKLYQNYCKSFRCPICRRFMINNYLKRVVNIATENKLFSHFVITLPGKRFRSHVTPDQSFKYITNKWNLFNNRYKKAFRHKLKYVLFNRSTKDGYAHLHILTEFIPIGWITEVIPKLRLGYFKIKYVQIHRLKNYLSKYWYKEHEWYIPKFKRHFSTSRSITLKLKSLKTYLYHWILLDKRMSFLTFNNFIRLREFIEYSFVSNNWFNWRISYSL